MREAAGIGVALTGLALGGVVGWGLAAVGAAALAPLALSAPARSEVVRAVRRKPPFAARTVLGGALLVGVVAVAGWGGLRSGVSVRTLAGLTEAGLATAALAALLAAPLAAWSVAVHGIAAERARGTLDLVLASDLSAAELVASKLVAWSARPLGLLLAALPFLAVWPAFGGIGSAGVAACVAAVVATSASAGAGGLLCSVTARDSDAAARLGVFVAAGILLAVLAALRGYPLLGPADPLALVLNVRAGLSSGELIDVVLAEYAEPYARAHFALALVLTAVAGVSLRPVAAALAGGPPPDRPVKGPDRPAVGDCPVSWRERNVPDSRRFEVAGGTLSLVVVYGAAVGLNLLSGRPLPPEWPPLGAWVLTLLFGVVAAGRAAWSVARDRESGLLDELYLAGIPAEEVVRLKWRAVAVWAVGCAGASAAHAASAVVLGGLPMFAFALIPVGFGWVCACTSVGLYWSVRGPTPKAALVRTVASLAAVVAFSLPFSIGLIGTPAAGSAVGVGAVALCATPLSAALVVCGPYCHVFQNTATPSGEVGLVIDLYLTLTFYEKARDLSRAGGAGG